jgi:hypothetical protein
MGARSVRARVRWDLVQSSRQSLVQGDRQNPFPSVACLPFSANPVWAKKFRFLSLRSTLHGAADLRKEK